tara:strand:- start:261 stop:503 length:243 start_codon:yes stop_codon:yes gene_type:complete
MKIFIEGFKEGQSEFGETIAVIINSILLTFVYVFGVGLTSIIGKIMGKRFLHSEKEKNKKSYWKDLNLEKEKIENYYKQF